MNKFLKKNYKKIIVICLIMLLLSNKMYEKFTNAQALDAVKSTEQKVNEMVSKIDGTHVRFPKKVVLDKGLAMGSLKMAPGNWLDYGIEVPAGKKLGIHAPGNGTMELHVDNTIKAQKLCLGNKCITEKDLSKLVDGFQLETLNHGHHSGKYIHTHSNGHMAVADKKYRTKYKMGFYTN